jgi:hypothetical protein
MTTYQFFREGAAVMYTEPHKAPFARNINIPNLIANGVNAGLADTSDVRAALPAAGFGAADVLRTFSVPAGFLLTMVGARVTTLEGGACTADIGNASATQTHLLAAAAAGYMGTFDLNSATTQITLVTDTHLGKDTYEGVMFITDGTIDITFVTAATAVAVFDVWAVGWKCF